MIPLIYNSINANQPVVTQADSGSLGSAGQGTVRGGMTPLE